MIKRPINKLQQQMHPCPHTLCFPLHLHLTCIIFFTRFVLLLKTQHGSRTETALDRPTGNDFTTLVAESRIRPLDGAANQILCDCTGFLLTFSHLPFICIVVMWATQYQTHCTPQTRNNVILESCNTSTLHISSL
jgi:hypothetical protein